MPRLLKYFLYFTAIIVLITLLVAGLVSYLVWFQTPFYFPKPTGPYAVGTKEYHWIDTSRKEIYSDDPAHPYRELMIKIWFPAQGNLPEKPTTPYAPYFVNYFKKNHSLIWLIGFSRPAYVYAKPDLALASDVQKFPVIIFSPGFRSTRDGNTAQCEELASHGYVVVGISHPYDNCVVQFPDGHIIDGLQSIAKRLNKMQNKSLSILAKQSAETWFLDVQFVLSQLEKLASNKDSMFYQRFDQNRIGMFGHSQGGSMAFKACQSDPRIKAAVNLDEGCLVGIDIKKPLSKPCMTLLGGNWVAIHQRPLTKAEWLRFGIHSLDEEKKIKAACLPILESLATRTKNDFYVVVLKNTGHFDFCDFTLYKWASNVFKFVTNFDYTGLHFGSINGLRSAQIINAYLLRFFDNYLKNKSSKLPSFNNREFAEVETLFEVIIIR